MFPPGVSEYLRSFPAMAQRLYSAKVNIKIESYPGRGSPFIFQGLFFWHNNGFTLARYRHGIGTIENVRKNHGFHWRDFGLLLVSLWPCIGICAFVLSPNRIGWIVRENVPLLEFVLDGSHVYLASPYI
jgi:hypothetical protein